MCNTDLMETLQAIGRSPDTFRRDTPQLLKTLESITEINRRMKNIGRAPERRDDQWPSEGAWLKNQAE